MKVVGFVVEIDMIYATLLILFNEKITSLNFKFRFTYAHFLLIVDIIFNI